ncbi:MAG: hypothetical protein KDD62_04305, partial [Bdellovibrionales bacterium]|nr:hypothetical protein [Bdellovibrionales bacterium]
CLPAGKGTNLGLASSKSSGLLAASASSRLATDKDGDGLLDIFDVDDDGDSVLNNFDPQFSIPALFPSFKVFSNLKLNLENSLNRNALGRDLTKEEVDALAANTTLAMEVKAASGEESELNCNGLTYCSTGGTGKVNGASFPEAFDSDSDGKGTMTAGGTGDFQLQTNLSSFNQANAGDNFQQAVTNASSPLAKLYLATLQFVFRSTPAIKTLISAPDTSAFTTNFTYPIAEGALGTQNNCIAIYPDEENDFVLEIQAWRPQRAGVTTLGEANFVDLGNSKITIDIPNAPTDNGSTPSAAGPNNCPATTYSTTDTNLTVGSDSIQDNFGDTDSDAANLVTFRVNLTDCLASAGQTLGLDQYVSIDLQFRNDVGDNAAQKLCVQQLGL